VQVTLLPHAKNKDVSVAAHIKLQVLFFCTFKDKDPETLFPKKMKYVMQHVSELLT
jgi:hypothetical protein